MRRFVLSILRWRILGRRVSGVTTSKHGLRWLGITGRGRSVSIGIGRRSVPVSSCSWKMEINHCSVLNLLMIPKYEYQNERFGRHDVYLSHIVHREISYQNLNFHLCNSALITGSWFVDTWMNTTWGYSQIDLLFPDFDFLVLFLRIMYCSWELRLEWNSQIVHM